MQFSNHILVRAVLQIHLFIAIIIIIIIAHTECSYMSNKKSWFQLHDS